MTEDTRTDPCRGGLCEQPDQHGDPCPGGDCRLVEWVTPATREIIDHQD